MPHAIGDGNASMSLSARYSSLSGRGAVVTGGANGIGRSIVMALVAQGCPVAFLDCDAAAGGRLAAETGARALFIACDLRDIDALRAALDEAQKRVGPIRVLVNNAASDDRHALASLTQEQWDERFAVNLRHQFFAAQHLAPAMAAAGGGSIVNLGSASWRTAVGGMVAYTTAKAGVEGLTRSLARELGGDGIRVNTVVPGWVMTEKQLTRWVTPEAEAETMARQCIPRRLKSEDIAAMVLFLAADDSAGCTAQAFTVDLGLS